MSNKPNNTRSKTEEDLYRVIDTLSSELEAKEDYILTLEIALGSVQRQEEYVSKLENALKLVKETPESELLKKHLQYKLELKEKDSKIEQLAKDVVDQEEIIRNLENQINTLLENTTYCVDGSKGLAH